VTELGNKEIAEAHASLRRMTGAEPYASTVLPMALELRAVRKAERERVLKAIEAAGEGRPTVPWLHNVLAELWRTP
jgi:hypothetical protein